MYKYDFEGKVALVTGAGAKQSMGREIAMEFARQGAKVIVVDKFMVPPTVRKENADWGGLPQIVAEMEALGTEGLAVEGDISDPVACQKIADESIKKFGKIDFFVNAVGLRGPSGIPTEDFDRDAWKLVMDVNLNGVFYLTQTVVKAMRIGGTQGKKIVYFSSQAGVEGTPFMTPYCVAKHGVLGLMKALSKELAPDGILVNAISPLTFATNFRDETAALEAKKQGVDVDDIIKGDKISRGGNNLNIPLGRPGYPADAAAFVMYLCSTGNEYMTGQNFLMNGGNRCL
jgi:3-oxoacyl-[acyl-carrier protein] reductase